MRFAIGYALTFTFGAGIFLAALSTADANIERHDTANVEVIAQAAYVERVAKEGW